jgi:endonuclease YncB( thermonuclease family)
MNYFLYSFIALSISFNLFAKQFKGEVTKITDGDTIHVESNDETYKIRMIGMDAPEEHITAKGKGVLAQQPWGTQATKYLEKMIPVGTKVTVEDEGTDRYKRTLGRVYYKDKDINLAMVEAGWAITYIICNGKSCNPGFFKREHVAEYVKACEDARAKHKGIFSTKNPLKEMPFEFRMRVQNRNPEKYVGEYPSKVTYAPEDYEEVDVCHRIFFMTKKDIEHAGFELP